MQGIPVAHHCRFFCVRAPRQLICTQKVNAPEELYSCTPNSSEDMATETSAPKATNLLPQGATATILMWSWLPDELLQRIVQLVAEREPRALAIFALLDQRSRALAAARLARMKPLLTAPFRLTVQQIFSGTGRWT